MSRIVLLVGVVGVPACGPVADATSEGSSSEGSTMSITSTTSGVTASSSVGTTAVDGSTGSSGTSPGTGNDDNDDDADEGPVCLLHHHEIGIPGECVNDGWCCPGEKCVPSPSYSECVPVVEMPAAVGEPCTRTGVEDDCDAGAVCRGLDPETSEGRCIELCGYGDEACDDPTMECALASYAPGLCLVPCDPTLGPACGNGDVCLPIFEVERFMCVPDELPAQPGGPGDPCVIDGDTLAGCDPGHVCLPDEALTIEPCAIDADDSCCTALCSLGDPMACVGIGAETCQAFATALGGTWPAEADGVGFCR